MGYTLSAEAAAALARMEARGDVLDSIAKKAQRKFDEVKRETKAEIEKRPHRSKDTATTKSNHASATASRARHRQLLETYPKELEAMGADAQVVAAALRSVVSELRAAWARIDEMEKERERDGLMEAHEMPSQGQPHAQDGVAGLRAEPPAVPSREIPPTTPRESVPPVLDDSMSMYHGATVPESSRWYDNGHPSPASATPRPDNGQGYDASPRVSSAYVMPSDCNADVLNATAGGPPTDALGLAFKPGEVQSTLPPVPFYMENFDISQLVQQQHTPAP